MVNALLNLVIQTGFFVVVIWVVLALLGLKWRFFGSARRGYSNLIKTLVAAAATWLWVSPQIEKEGIGQVAQSRLTYEDESDEEGEEPWE